MAAFGIAYAALSRSFAGRYLDYGDPTHKYRTLELLAQLDVMRSLFYSAIPAALMALLFPIPRGETRRGTSLSIAALFALIAGCLPLTAPFLTRPEIGLESWPAIVSVYVAINVFAMIRLGRIKDFSPITKRMVILSPLISDLIAPAFVWHVYCRMSKRPLRMGRLWPAISLAVAPMIPWILSPLPIESAINCDPALSRVLEGRYYQVMLDRGGVIVVDEDNATVRRLDLIGGSSARHLKLEGMGLVQAVGLDSGSQSLIAVDPSSGKTLVIDADDLRIRATLQITNAPRDELGQCRTYWFAERQMLLAFCANGLYRMCPDGKNIQARLPTQPGDLAFDAERDEIYLADWGQPLLALSAENLQPIRRLAAPMMKERLLLDDESDRLLIAYPEAGRLLVVDAESFEAIGWIQAFPGVRAMAADQSRRLLLLGGLSPVIEVRSLDDFSLVRRLAAPPWVRWIAVDPDGKYAYITSGSHGLWRLDLRKATEDRPVSVWQKIDPFYMLARFISSRLASEDDGGQDNASIVQPRMMSANPCSGEQWRVAQ